jgi:hypothetical protein
MYVHKRENLMDNVGLAICMCGQTGPKISALAKKKFVAFEFYYLKLKLFCFGNV